jgi:hypothetical protein
LPIISGTKSKIAISIPEVIASNIIRARELVKCQEKNVTVIVAMFCIAKITETAPSNNPTINNIIIFL